MIAPTMPPKPPVLNALKLMRRDGLAAGGAPGVSEKPTLFFLRRVPVPCRRAFLAGRPLVRRKGFRRVAARDFGR